MGEMRKYFRPEFINRIDDIVVFSTLDQEDLRKIVKIQLQQVQDKLQQRNITLELDEEALNRVASEGYDPDFGARPLKRVIQHRLVDPLSTKLIAGDFKDGDKIKVSAGEIGGMVISKV